MFLEVIQIALVLSFPLQTHWEIYFLLGFKEHYSQRGLLGWGSPQNHGAVVSLEDGALS
jgi:hypothetical protein